MPQPHQPTAQPAQRVITPELIRDALASIPPDIDRDTWARIGMAVKSELGDAGFDTWCQWSARAEGSDPVDVRDTWKSVKAGGRVRIGTLFHIAKQHGFRFTDAAPVQAPVQPRAAKVKATPSAAEEQAAERARHLAAAEKAQALWAAGIDADTTPYLQRKGVHGYGVRRLQDGSTLVPLRDADGFLWGVQTIAPEPPAAGSEKRFLKNARKSGLWHWIGTVQASAHDADPVVWLVAEGYATAATLHEATGRPVAVAFDAGNLMAVCRALLACNPAARLLICGDDDAGTEARKGFNPGKAKAGKAARELGMLAVFPAGLPDGGSDFNDLASYAGIDAVRRITDPAVSAMIGAKSVDAAGDGGAPARNAGRPPSGGSGDGRGGRGSGPAPGADDEADPEPADRTPFRLDDAGVWHVPRDAEGNEKRPVWLCDPLHVTARTRADDANGWGYLLEFKDPDGNAKTWAMPSSMLSGDGSEWASRLRDMGLRMGTGTRTRGLVAQYIDTRNPATRVTCTDRVGWHGSAYVLPSRTMGAPEDKRYVFQSESGMEDTFRRHGNLADWQRSVAAPCVGNSRFIFALCCAFAGPMLRLAGMESGGFHFRADSSKGKTSTLLVAASVWGRPSYMQRWRTTTNALESIAVQHCDGLLILDEFGQLDPREAGDCAYLLANGQEKGRATRNGQARKRRTWVELFLSSGEVSLADHIAAGGKQVRAGQEVRMADIPMDAGAGMGGVEALNGHNGPGDLVDAIVGAAAAHYGSAGLAWLEWACANHAALPSRLRELVDQYRDDFVPEASSEQVRRVGGRFALVAAAGELATEAGVTGWRAGEALTGVRRCFNAWLAARGHLDNGEDATMMRQVRRFLELNGEGRFTWWHRAADDHSPKTLNRAGFRRLIGDDGKPIRSDVDHQREYGERMSVRDGEHTQVEYVVLREVFRREVCQGFDADQVAKLLQRRGHLEHEADRLTIKHRLPGMGKAPCYHLKPTIFDDDL